VAEAEDESMPGIGRLLALTDGVVAIALTLLVLQLQVPATAIVVDPNSSADLWRALDVDGSELTSYLVSFVIISQFWLVHHRSMRGMRGHSEGLAWRNFGFLLALTLMPFSSDLMGRYGNNPVAITLFALNLALITFATQWIVLYADRHSLVDADKRQPRAELTARIRVGLSFSIVALSVVLAWTATSAAKYIWALFLFVPLAALRLTRLFDQTEDRARTPAT
jgi:uncharacterized membrane protein